MAFYKTEEELVDKARDYVEKASNAEIYKMKEAARKKSRIWAYMVS